MVFDLDGLLIDSEPFWRRAEIEVFATVGVQLTEADTRQTMGLRIDGAVLHWYQRRPWSGLEPVEVERAVTARVAELIESMGEPMPGALDVVDLCRDRSIPMAVCSGSYAQVIEAALDRLGLTSSMSAWHSAEWEPLGKPHPGAYLSTAAKLGVSPAALDDDVRVFLAPGVYHCGGGPGPDRFDMVAALDDWDAAGRAPASIIATKLGSPISRPLCVYPAAAHYTGTGDIDRAENYACK